MNSIVIQGRDGSTWSYHAICGEEYSAPETGWVLVVEDAPEQIAPQTLTADEVLGDLRSMQATNPPPDALVRRYTEEMIAELDQRVQGLEQRGLSADEERERIEALRGELATLGPG